jgi:hypothetical protein
MKLPTLNRIARIIAAETELKVPYSKNEMWEKLKNFTSSKSKKEAAERIAFCLFSFDFSHYPATRDAIISQL